MVLSRLTDRLVLRPTRHAIAVEHKTRHTLPFGGGELEFWHHRSGPEAASAGRDAGRADGGGMGTGETGTGGTDIVLLKFGGTGGRAERATEHPGDYWSDLRADVWALNPPGYGGSSGRASLRDLADVAIRAYEHVRATAAGRPILVTGNSLGCVTALYLAARRPVSGLLLRNSPPLRELIIDRFGWWNLWLGARLIARHVPPELDAVSNAAQCSAPAVFVSSGRDRIVWPRHQDLVIDAYAGEKRVLRLADADHACSLTEDEQRDYGVLLDWLRERLFAAGEASVK